MLPDTGVTVTAVPGPIRTASTAPCTPTIKTLALLHALDT